MFQSNIKRILIIATLLVTFANPAFCFDQKLFATLQMSFAQPIVYSPDSNDPAAQITTLNYIGIDSFQTIWGEAFGLSFGQSLLFPEGGNDQYLFQSSSNEQRTVKIGRYSSGVTLGLSLNLQYIFGHKTEDPIRFFAGVEATGSLGLFSKEEIYLTHDSNRSPACTAAVTP